MPPARLCRVVAGQTPANQAQVHAWGRTSGGGSPTLDSPSWGTASITDAGVGVLDVTFERAMGSSNYAALSAVMSTTAFWQPINDPTSGTPTVQRFLAKDATNTLADPVLGWTWIFYGV